jgi:hypothetical protein
VILESDMSSSPSPGFASSPTTAAGQNQFRISPRVTGITPLRGLSQNPMPKGSFSVSTLPGKLYSIARRRMSDRVNNRSEGETMESAAHKLWNMKIYGLGWPGLQLDGTVMYLVTRQRN